MKNYPIDELRKKYRYDHESGDITYSSGKPAFRVEHSRGYLTGGIGYKVYYAHRVAWALYYGCWPEDMIDHVNGDRQDNRISNLREASRSENIQNRRINSNNKTGYKGVHFNKSKGAYFAQIQAFGVKKQYGPFSNPEDASLVYIEKSKTKHGEFGRLL